MSRLLLLLLRILRSLPQGLLGMLRKLEMLMTTLTLDFNSECREPRGTWAAPSTEDSCRKAAAKIKAGSRVVMTPEQRREYLKNSEYGRLTGLSALLSEEED